MIENGNALKYVSISLKDLKMFNKKYSLFINLVFKKCKNSRIYYLLNSKNSIDRVKGLYLSRNYIKTVVI